MEKSSDDPNVREEYFARRKVVLDEMAAVREAELWLREAIQKGRVEGRAEVAKNLLDLGMEISKIAEFLKIMADPNHVEYETMQKWAQSQWYRNFDMELINKRLENILRVCF